MATRTNEQGLDAIMQAAWRGMAHSTIRAALARCETIHLKRGEHYQDSTTGRMCLVSHGRLHVYYARPDREESDALAGLIGPGDFFSVGVDPTTGRITRAKARSDSRLVAMRFDDAYQLAMAHPDFNMLVLTVLVSMTEAQGRRIESLLIGDAAGRVAWALGDLMGRFGEVVDDGCELRYRVTQSELAELCGVTRETVNKTISDFVSRGWASMRGHTIIVHDLDALRRLAG